MSRDAHFKHFRHAPGRQQLRRSTGQDFAVMKPDDLLREFPHERQIVRDEQDGQMALLVEPRNKRQQGLRRSWVAL